MYIFGKKYFYQMYSVPGQIRSVRATSRGQIKKNPLPFCKFLLIINEKLIKDSRISVRVIQ